MLLISSLSFFLLQTSLDTLKEFNLNEIKISVNKFEAKQLEMNGFVRHINDKEIAKENSATTADLLSNSGNFFVQKSQAGGGSPVMRGFEANKIVLVVDGIKINNLIYRGGHLQNILRVDQFSLEKIDSFFGPNSLVYGSDALGGVIYLKTKNPKFNLNEFSFLTRYGSANNEKTSHFDFNLGNSKIANYLSLSFSSFGNTIQGKNRSQKYPDFGKLFNSVKIELNKDEIIQNTNENVQLGTAYKQFDFVNKLSLKQSESINHTFNFQFSTTSDVPRYDRLFFKKETNPSFAVWNYGPEKRLMLAYQLDLKKSKIYDEATITIANQQIEESRITRRYKNENLFKQLEKVKVNSINLDFLKNLDEQFEIQYGFEIKKDEVDSKASVKNIYTNQVSKAITRYPDGGGQMKSTGFYSFYKYKAEKVILNFGLRVSKSKLLASFIDTKFVTNNYNKVFQQSLIFTKSLGVKYFLNKNIHLSSNFSDGFRSPNIDDLGKVFEAIPGQIIIPNVDLQPEKSKNIEFILNSKILTNAIFYIGIFQTNLKNAIAVAPTTLNGISRILVEGSLLDVYTSKNINSAQINGHFIGFDYQLNPNFKFNANFNRTKGFKNHDKNLAMGHIPPTFGKVAFSFRKNQLFLELNMLYNGFKPISEFELNGEDNPQFAYPEGSLAWQTFNLKSNYETQNKFKFSINIENILDLNYRTFASGINANGRNLVVSIAKKI